MTFIPFDLISILQIVGIALLGVGIWGVAELKYYLDLSETDYTSVPYTLIGVGSFMFVGGFFGCCALLKNISWLLRVVSTVGLSSTCVYVDMSSTYAISRHVDIKNKK